MIIGMWQKGITIDLILFADTGAERPETYEYIGIFNDWLIEHGLPKIKEVQNVDKDGEVYTLEHECLTRHALPSIAYGHKKCSEKHKIRPQEKYCNNLPECRSVWDCGEKVNKYVGYDAGEERRKNNAFAIDLQDKKYKKVYALIDWGWYREDCIKVIQDAGLPLPGKSSCFFCPSMKKQEIKELRKNHPELFERATALEKNAAPNLLAVKGLGRNWSWESYIKEEESQISFCQFYEENEMPCGCYDG